MIWDAFKNNDEIVDNDISKGWTLISLSIATSIDALAVGFSLGIINSEIFLPSIIIGIVAALMSLIGIKMGELLSSKFGSRISAFGGIVLILIGINIIAEHLNWY
jgi:putative Mn2+ efflux pump MntP